MLLVRLLVSVDEQTKRTRSEKSAQAAKSERANKGGNGEVWFQNFVLIHLILSPQSSRGFFAVFSIRFPTVLEQIVIVNILLSTPLRAFQG